MYVMWNTQYIIIIIIIIIITFSITSLSPWSKFLLEKLRGSQLVKNSPHFMEPEGSLPLSQVPATCPYPEPDRSKPYSHIPLPEDQYYYHN